MVTSAAQSLSLRALLQAAIDRTGLVSSAPGLAGLSGAAKALAVAAAARQQPALIVVPSDRDLDVVIQDLRFFLSALEGWSEAEAERQVLPFPSQEVDPYRGLAPHFEVASARARALHGLASGAVRVVVASATALLPRMSPVDRIRSSAIELRTGQDVEPMLLTELLVDAGYSREDPVDEHGEFCVRGGVVDFFPAGDTHPYRLEFVGDTIESIRRYDPASQRSVETVDLCTVFPLREAFPGAGATNEDEKLDRSASIVDYLVNPRRIKVFVSEWDDVKRHIVERQESIESSYADAVKRGERVVAEPATLIASWDILEPVLSKATHLEQLEIGGDGRRASAGARRWRERRDASSTPTDLCCAAIWSKPPRRARTARRARHARARCTSRVSRCVSSTDAFPTGSTSCAARATSTRPCCSSPPPADAPSGRSSC